MKYKIGDNVLIYKILPEFGEQYISENIIGLTGRVVDMYASDDYPLRVKIKCKPRGAYFLKFEEVRKIVTNAKE